MNRTTAYWDHSTLGYALISPHTVTVDSKQSSKKVVGGSARYRAFNPAGKLTCQVSYQFTQAQLVEFKRFYEEDLNYGSNYFYMTMRTSSGLQRSECLIYDGYDIGQTGVRNYTVKLSLYVKKEYRVTEPDLTRGLIDGLYATAPATGLVDAGIMSRYYPPLTLVGVDADEEFNVVGDLTATHTYQCTFKESAEVINTNVVDALDISGTLP